jgi:hypothetical protein
MIDFTKYIGSYIVLMTNDFFTPEEVPGIRDGQAVVFRYGGVYTLVRPLIAEDLKDEDFIPWLHSMWKHDEKNIINFIRNAKRHASKQKTTRGDIQKSKKQ